MKYQMKIVFFILGILSMILLASCSVNRELTTNTLSKQVRWLDGKWIGTGYQVDAYSNDTWPIELDVSLSKKSCTVKYPSLDCGGEWQLVQANAHRATFKEVITDGKNKCYDGGRLEISLIDKNHISYSFFYPDDGKLGAFSTLVRASFLKEQSATTL